MTLERRILTLLRERRELPERQICRALRASHKDVLEALGELVRAEKVVRKKIVLDVDTGAHVYVWAPKDKETP